MLTDRPDRNAANAMQAINETAIAFVARSADDGRAGGDSVDLEMPYCCHEVRCLSLAFSWPPVT